jgi:outer membrane protein TolC
MIFMTPFFYQQKRRFLRPLPLVLGLMAIPSYSVLARAPLGPTEQWNANLTTLSGGPLRLQQVALITLKNSPAIMLGKLGVHSARAGARMESGAFDIYTSVVGSANKNRPIQDPFSTDQDTLDLTFGLNKGFRTGIQTGVSAGIHREDSRIIPEDTINLFQLNLNITIPLLKGRGYVSAAADETSARLQSQAAELDFYHGISNILLDSTNAYWDYKAAIENLKVQQESEQRVQDWDNAALEGIKQRGRDVFLKGHEVEVSRVQGYLAEQRRNTSTAIERVNSTKGALGVFMGIQPSQVANIGEPSEEFSSYWGDILAKLKQQMLDKWVAKAKENRLDIQAAKLNQEASAVQLAKARRDVLPQFDFGFNAGHNTAELGDGYNRYVGALNGDIRGTDVGATLTFSYPLGNNVAKGQRDLANATHNINVINTNDLMRRISVQVGIDAKTLMARLKEAVEAKKAVELYAFALEGSYNSSRNSLLDNPNTLFNLIDLDERLTGARNGLVTSLQGLAKAIAQLRFQTGTILMDGSMDTNELKLEDMSKIPAL